MLILCAGVCTQISRFVSPNQNFRLELVLQFTPLSYLTLLPSPFLDLIKQIKFDEANVQDTEVHFPSFRYFMSFRYKGSPRRYLLRHSPSVTQYFVS